MRVFAGLTRELQSQISHDVADRMHDVEDAEMFRWEKTRIAMEKSLKGKTAVALGKLGDAKGGRARAKRLSAAKRKAIAKKAAKARWSK